MKRYEVIRIEGQSASIGLIKDVEKSSMTEGRLMMTIMMMAKGI